MKQPPPSPLEVGLTTPATNAALTAASMALPPRRNWFNASVVERAFSLDTASSPGGALAFVLGTFQSKRAASETPQALAKCPKRRGRLPETRCLVPTGPRVTSLVVGDTAALYRHAARAPHAARVARLLGRSRFRGAAVR